MGPSAFTSRPSAAISGAIGLSLALAACGGGTSTNTPAASGGGASASAECADYTQYGDLKGKTVSIYTGIVTPEDTPHIATNTSAMREPRGSSTNSSRRDSL